MHNLQQVRRHHEEAVNSIPFLVIAGPLALAMARAAIIEWREKQAAKKAARKASLS